MFKDLEITSLLSSSEKRDLRTIDELSDDHHDAEQILPQRSRRRNSLNLYFTVAVLLCSLLANVYLLLSLRAQSCLQTTNRKSYFGLAARPLIEREEGYRTVEWDPEASNWTDVDALWDATTDGFGVVALDHDWALNRGLMRSTDWPLDSSKGMYVIPVYHALHCLRSLRIYFHRMSSGQPVKKYWIAHGYHCHEVIRQELMCSASDTLVGRLIHQRIGEGEVRQCSDWEYIRRWASENSAGYSEDEYGKPHYINDTREGGGWY